MDIPNNNLETKKHRLTSEIIQDLIEKYPYPITQKSQEIYNLIDQNSASIIIGHTGSGKSTIVPPILLKHKLETGAKGKIAVTQPRTIAARTVSERVSDIVESKVGETVGYRYRGESKVSRDTDIEFVTDGLILAEINSDPLLEKYSYIMVDEAHERSLNIDFLLGLLKKTNQNRIKNGMEPIKMVVASATIDKEKFENYFSEGENSLANSIEIEGKLFPITKNYLDNEVLDYTSEAAKTVLTSINNGDEGHILIFMPGKSEIDKTKEKVEYLLNKERISEDYVVIPLHSELDSGEQKKAFAKTDKRKIIIATNIAETSITIDGVGVVIDSGALIQSEYDSTSGTKVLKSVEHSAAGLDQRAGRAGRTNPGTCYRLFTEANFDKRSKHSNSEINRSDITSMLLQMKAMGINNVYEFSSDNPEGFDYIEAPHRKTIDEALGFLKTMGLLDENGEVTVLGAEVSKLPLEPRLGKMVVEAKNFDCVPEIVTIASFLNSDNSIFVNPKKLDASKQLNQQKLKKENNFLSILNTYNEYTKVAEAERDRWFTKYGINQASFKEALKSRASILSSLKDLVAGKQLKLTEENANNIQKCIFTAFIDNLSVDRGGLKTSKPITATNIYPESNGQLPDYLFTYGYPFQKINTDQKHKKTTVYLHNIMNIKPEWIIELAPHLVKTKIRIEAKNGSFSREISRDVTIQRMNYNLESKIEKDVTLTAEEYLIYLQDFKYYLNSATEKFNTQLSKLKIIYPNLALTSVPELDYFKLYSEQVPQENTDILNNAQETLTKFILECNPELKSILEEYDEPIEKKITFGSREILGELVSIDSAPAYLLNYNKYEDGDNIVKNYEAIKSAFGKYPIYIPSTEYVSKGLTYGWAHAELQTINLPLDTFVSQQILKITGRETTLTTYKEEKDLDKFPNTFPITLEYLTVDSEIINPISGKPLPVYIFKSIDQFGSLMILKTFNKNVLDRRLIEARELNEKHQAKIELTQKYIELNEKLQECLKNDPQGRIKSSAEGSRIIYNCKSFLEKKVITDWEFTNFSSELDKYGDILERLTLVAENGFDEEGSKIINNYYLDRVDSLINENLSKCPLHGYELNVDNNYTCKYSHSINDAMISEISSSKEYSSMIYAGLIVEYNTLRAFFYDGKGVNSTSSINSKKFKKLNFYNLNSDDINPIEYHLPKFK